MKIKLALLAAASGLAAACASPVAEAQPAPAALPAPEAEATPQVSASEQLAALFKQSDEDNLRRNPLSALFRGDMRYADQLGDMFTEKYYAAERKASEEELRRLAAIDRAALSPTEQLAYDVFKRQTEITLRGLREPLLSLYATRPIDHFRPGARQRSGLFACHERRR